MFYLKLQGGHAPSPLKATLLNMEIKFRISLPGRDDWLSPNHAPQYRGPDRGEARREADFDTHVPAAKFHPATTLYHGNRPAIGPCCDFK